MLSDEEQREMREMARSASLREEFQKLRGLSQLPRAEPVNLDELVTFLTFMSRLCPERPAPRPLVEYPRALL